MVRLTTNATERSTYAVEVAFTDEAGEAVIPLTVTWSLYKKVAGVETVVNGRAAVSVTPASTITVVLEDDDLAIVTGESKTRYVLIEATYDSDLGDGLPLRAECQFAIENLVGVD